MSLPCRVDRMPTKLPDFPLFLPALSFPSFVPFLSPTPPLSLSLSPFPASPTTTANPSNPPSTLFVALHSSEAGIPIIAGLVSLYEFALCTLDRLNCIRFARDTRDFVFALRVNDPPPLFFGREGSRKREEDRAGDRKKIVIVTINCGSKLFVKRLVIIFKKKNGIKLKQFSLPGIIVHRYFIISGSLRLNENQIALCSIRILSTLLRTPEN